LSFQEDAIGIRLRDAIGVDNMMRGSDYPHSPSFDARDDNTFMPIDPRGAALSDI
jgi:hypothetical protein